MSVKHLGALTNASREDHARHAVALRKRGNTRGGLTVKRLRVNRSLAGEDKIGVRNRSFEAHRTRDEIETRLESRIEERREGPAKPTRGTGTWCARTGTGVKGGVRRFHGLHELLEITVEFSNHRGVRTLLRPENGARAIRPKKRVRDVTRDLDADLKEPRIEAAHVDAGKAPG